MNDFDAIDIAIADYKMARKEKLDYLKRLAKNARMMRLTLSYKNIIHSLGNLILEEL